MQRRRMSGPPCPPYLVPVERARMECETCDVLVIGSGIAGLTAALAAADAGAAVRLVAKASLRESNTSYAQGGIAAVLDAGQRERGDSLDHHVADTCQAGAGHCDEALVRDVLGAAAGAMERLFVADCRFDRSSDGRLALTREGGHTCRRILHADGDATGREIGRALIAAITAHPRITRQAGVFVIDLLVDQGVCRGAVCEAGDGIGLVVADAVVLASGGCGQLFRETSNPLIATGDGLAMAYRAGAELCDLEFYQFHPTCLYIAGKPRHLITEAMRGEGAHLLTQGGERFMPRHHDQAELAPRDIVSQAIVAEIGQGGFPHVWLDATHLPADFLRRRFPTIYRTCAELDIDITRDWIPVHPAAHYHCGGVWTDAQGATSVSGLYAAGEVACTGFNGANRLASNSLLEGLVLGERAGRSAAGRTHQGPLRTIDFRPEKAARPDIDVADLTRALRALMWRQVGIVRQHDGLETARRTLDFWLHHQGRGRFRERAGWEMQNMLLLGSLIARAASTRTTSIGTHLRSDGAGPADPRHLCLFREE